MIPDALIVIGFVLFLLIFFGVFLFGRKKLHFETAEKRAGRQGEAFATEVIREILKEGDILLTNVRIHVGDKNAELDNVVINNRGVFIIEVKNYSGDLIGEEEDAEWIKIHNPSGGNAYQKTVKNPIKQVRRQKDILTQYLKQHGLEPQIEGYAFLLEQNSPVDSPVILKTQADIANAIHYGKNNNLRGDTKTRIAELLQD